MSTPRRVSRVAIYARLSVTKEESVSIPRQVESARSIAAARGWEVVLVATDDGVSATKNKPEERVGWRQVVDSTERFEAVIVWKVDRLARRVLDFLHADEALQKRGAGLVAVQDPIDMTSASGRAFATMLAVFGEMEAAAMSARVSAARRQLVRDGRRVGGRPPFGYRNVPNPGGAALVLAQDPETIGSVRDPAARAAAGESLYSIARRLESAGVRPRARRRRDATGDLDVHPSPATRWHEASVETMLRAPALAGMTPYTPGRLLPPDLVARLTRPNPHGVTAAVLVATPSGDGPYPVIGEGGALVVLDLHHDPDAPTSWGDGRVYREVVLDAVF